MVAVGRGLLNEVEGLEDASGLRSELLKGFAGAEMAQKRLCCRGLFRRGVNLWVLRLKSFEQDRAPGGVLYF